MNPQTHELRIGFTNPKQCAFATQNANSSDTLYLLAETDKEMYFYRYRHIELHTLELGFHYTINIYV